MPLPHFVIAGERRCGTTTLADRLSSHPDIVVHGKRDSGFFVDPHIRKGGAPVDWSSTHTAERYEDFFSALGPVREAMVGEKSADYLYFRPAHKRMADYLPNTKFIMILRNPVSRAWSHYWNEVGKGREPLPFAEAITAEAGRRAAAGYEGYHLSYVARGFYDESLADFFQEIPRARCLVVILESLISDPRAVLTDITNFLEVPAFGDALPELRSNPNWTMVHRTWARQQPIRAVADAYSAAARSASGLVARSRGDRRRVQGILTRPFFQESARFAMDVKIRAELFEIFEPHTRRLEQMIGRELPAWRQRRGAAR
ncbi:MAG: sulfotransferase [Parvibaculaceae bacterium]